MSARSEPGQRPQPPWLAAGARGAKVASCAMEFRYHRSMKALSARAGPLGTPTPLRLLVALTQAPEQGLSLREIARSMELADSTALEALRKLVAGGLATVERGRGRPRYRPSGSERERLARAFALGTLPRDQVVAIVVRASPAAEFAAVDRGGLIVVKSDRARPGDARRLAELLAAVAPGIPVVDAYHADVVRTLAGDRSLRDRALRARTLKGRVDRSLPDRIRHGHRHPGRRLGRPHPSLRMPSRRTLQRVARRYGLRSVGLFGSAVRSDFRPDSDVDVLVGFRGEAKPSLFSIVELQQELERLFDRDVDVATEASLRPWIRARAARELVPLHGR